MPFLALGHDECKVGWNEYPEDNHMSTGFVHESRGGDPGSGLSVDGSVDGPDEHDVSGRAGVADLPRSDDGASWPVYRSPSQGPRQRGCSLRNQRSAAWPLPWIPTTIRRLPRDS